MSQWQFNCEGDARVGYEMITLDSVHIFEMKGDCLPQVIQKLVQSFSISHYRYLHTGRYINRAKFFILSTIFDINMDHISNFAHRILS